MLKEWISRRDFIKTSVAATIATTFYFHRLEKEIAVDTAKALVSFALDWATGTDWAKPESQRPYPTPGWLETSRPKRKEILNTNDGGRAYLLDMFKLPIIRDAVKMAYHDLFNPNSSPVKKVGDAFGQHLDYARISLRQNEKQLDPKLSNHEPSLQDRVHIAFFTMALVYGPYLSPSQINELMDNTTNISGDWSTDGLQWQQTFENFVPHIFPVNKKKCTSFRDIIARCLGGDRTIHLVEHMFLAHQYLFGKRWGLQDAERIPRGLKFLSEWVGSNWTSLKALINNIAIGVGWEGKETRDYLEGISLRDDDGKLFPTGLADSNYPYDMSTNFVAYLAANIVDNDKITQWDVNLLVNFLNSNLWYDERESQRQPTHQFARRGVIIEQLPVVA